MDPVYRVVIYEKKSGQRKYHPGYTRTIAPQTLIRCEENTLCNRAVSWVLPWTIHQYPGFQRGLMQLFNHRWSWQAIRGWRSGRRSMRSDVARLLADHIRQRCETGLALVSELNDYAATVDIEPRGWRVVADRDGDGVLRDARNRVGRRKQTDRPA